jgi:hypothetical protein
MPASCRRGRKTYVCCGLVGYDSIATACDWKADPDGSPKWNISDSLSRNFKKKNLGLHQIYSIVDRHTAPRLHCSVGRAFDHLTHSASIREMSLRMS